MEIQILRHDTLSIEFYVKGFPLPIVNAIRRYALTKVPTMAIDLVDIYVNTSALFDEILAHRLAMIPLYSEIAIKKYRDPDIETCRRCVEETEEKPPAEICNKCFVYMRLEASADGREVVVYSGDIKSSDPDVRPVYDNIPIVILAPGQRIEMDLRARLGRGLEHAKFSPATVAVVRYVMNVVIDRKLCTNCGNCVSVCPRAVLSKNNGVVTVVNNFNCIACKQCIASCETKAIKVEPRPDEYVVYIESSGALKPETIVREALNILISELEELSQKVVEWREKKDVGGSWR